LVNDPGEMTDVAGDHPEVVEQMEKWIAESHTPPVP